MAGRKLYRYTLQLYEPNLAGTDERQIPVSGATITPYKRGAWVNDASGSGTTITVHDRGGINPGDEVVVGTTDDTSQTVSSVTATTVVVDTSMEFSDGDRLVSITDGPTMYSDANGDDVLASLTSNSSGRAVFYSYMSVLDIEVNNGGTKTMLSDVPGEAGKEEYFPEDWSAVPDGSTDCQAAFVDALQYLEDNGGGRLVLGPGTYRFNSNLNISMDNLEIVGAGRGLTTLQINHSGIGFTIATNSDNVAIRDLTIDRNVAGTGGNLFIVGGGTGLVLEDVEFTGGGAGIVDTGSIDARVSRVSFEGADTWASFIKLIGAVRPHFTSVVGLHQASLSTAGVIVDTDTIGARFVNCSFGPKAVAATGGVAALIQEVEAGTDAPQDTLFIGCYLSGGTTTGTAPAVRISGGEGLQFIGCNIEDSDIGYDIDGGVGIQIMGGHVVGINDTGIDIEAAATHVRIVELLSSHVSSSSAGAFDHVNIAANTDDVSVNGLTVGNFLRAGGSSAQFGVNVESGTSDRIQVTGVRAINADVSGAVSNSSDSRVADWSHNIEEGVTNTVTHTAPLAVSSSVGGSVGDLVLSGTEVTANVQNVHTIYLSQSSPTSFASMTGATNGQRVTLVKIGGSTTTITETGNLVMSGTTFVMDTTGDTITFIYNSDNVEWYEEARGDKA